MPNNCDCWAVVSRHTLALDGEPNLFGGDKIHKIIFVYVLYLYIFIYFYFMFLYTEKYIIFKEGLLIRGVEKRLFLYGLFLCVICFKLFISP